MRNGSIKTLLLAVTLGVVSSSIAFAKDSLEYNPKKLVKQAKEVAASPYHPARLTSRFASWGISPLNSGSAINLENAWKRFNKKQDIVVAVVDTGVDPRHPFLQNNLYVPQGIKSETNYGLDFSKGTKKKTEPVDTHGHGTHVAGIIKSVFPQVKLFVLKYFNRQASGQENLDSTIKALEFAVNSNVDIINYSGGGPEPSLEELRILKKAEEKGILVVAAAGNEESNIDVRSKAYYPASYRLSNIITVAAHNQGSNLIPSSNYGVRSVDLSAPGHHIRSALPYGRSGYLTGTSQATAFVSGVAALMKANYPKLTTKQIISILKSSAKKDQKLVSKIATGGKLDASEALKMAKEVSKGAPQRAVANKRPGQIYYRSAK